MNPLVRVGLECCLDRPPSALTGSRFGLLMNQASVDRNWQYACDLLARRFPGQLAAIFTPQHGLWGEQQANMIETQHGRYEPLGVPLYSLYSETRQPTPEMLQSLDCLVVDLQDVGTRVYTFVWTVVKCLQACATAGVRLVILDRPNPLGNETIEGPLLNEKFTSFVGLATIPMRHGLTIGELARLVNQEWKIHADLEVIRMEGWRPNMLFAQTGRAWTLPSPNMPRFETALFYPGQVLLEGTNLSEGRGTTIPFEVVGAPFIEPQRLYDELENTKRKLPDDGIRFRPVRFMPTFDKWRGQSCGGVAWHAHNPCDVRSFAATLSVLAAVHRLWPDNFQWLPPPYEYESEKMPIDILFGSSKLRETLAAGNLNSGTVLDLAAVDSDAWKERTQWCRLYE